MIGGATVGAMRLVRNLCVVAVGVAVIGCGSTAPRPSRAGAPNVMSVQPPHGLSGSARTEFLSGRTVVSSRGCLACHQIGHDGNAGPGANLSRVGRRLSPNAIVRVMLNPRSPMPSYRDLPRRQLKELVYFLSELR